ncbi:hypothetical protein HQQ81_11445 [Microbacteriaceae bacterium VKM Ac-2854]|nr:hypothetical protein [Microbacteriaceae bacterium VKM Ac-2854]
MNASTRCHRALVLAAFALVALAGCTAAPAAGTPAPPATSAGSTPTPTPTEDADAGSVILGSQVADVVAADSTVIARIDFFGPTADAVEILTDAFGAEPTVADYEQGIESPPDTDYDWGGFVLRDPDSPAADPEYPEFVALVTAAAVGEVVIAGPGGVRVGDAVADLASKWAGEPAVLIGESSFHFDMVEVGPAPAAGEQPHELSVFAYAKDGSSTITQISTPAQNWGV